MYPARRGPISLQHDPALDALVSAADIQQAATLAKFVHGLMGIAPTREGENPDAISPAGRLLPFDANEAFQGFCGVGALASGFDRGHWADSARCSISAINPSRLSLSSASMVRCASA
jgi:hypothetical protein